eukprot:TRINITY_DN7833_c0_g1_i1.p1 TRINITY_DN7833_c0_g1~~TRINITY_DN7833_c0_g1_i1.p1  ORF type:complete len:177 (+),score=43.83 TRINITY_DN7833_c0_g1_i1:36-533(+)
MIRRPPRSTHCISSAASDVYKRQVHEEQEDIISFSDDKKSANDFSSILFSNIGSFMGGRSKPWRNAKKSLDITKEFKRESLNDNQLEIVTFANIFQISLEALVSGNTRRIAQDGGPFKIEFKRGDVVTYMNIDGEFYKVKNPVQATVKLATIPSETINVAFKNAP